MSDATPSIPSPAPAPATVRPASYGVSLLLILVVLVLSQLAGEALAGMSRPGAEPGPGTLVLLAVGGAAVLALVVVNARFLWASMGNLRFALALITVWAVSSVLGTLVVQRFPNQTDEGYAKTFVEATGDFFYNASHVGGGVQVRPEADVHQWFEQQERLFGAAEAKEIRKEWMLGEAGRLRQAEIQAWTRAHEPMLREVLAVVSWMRLPEAFQISVWFKSLLGLLCTALVIVVIQRWRGEWRQIGWAMSHLGMVVFCIGASVRATTKVDGFMSMRVGETRATYARKVDPDTAAHDPRVQLDASGREAFLVTPLDFEFELHRFRTEYPKHLFISFPDEGVEKSWRMSPRWDHEFLGGRLHLQVADLHDDVEAELEHRDRADGEPRPAVRVLVSADWLQEPATTVMPDRGFPLMPPGDLEYLAQYRRARDEAEYAELTAGLGGFGRLWSLDGTGGGHVLGEVRPGGRFALPGQAGTELRVRDVWPDWSARANEGGHSALPRMPALELDVLRDGAEAGRVVVFGEEMQAEDTTLPVELRFEFDAFRATVPVRYRLVDLAGRAPALVTFRDDVVADVHDLVPGDEVTLGPTGDRLRFDEAFERHTSAWRTRPSEPAGRTPDDMYYAALPAELVLEARGEAVAPLVSMLSKAFASGQQPPGVAGIVPPDAFAAGEGQFTLTEDGRGLLVRLVSDHRTLSTFPAAGLGELLAAAGLGVPFQLDYLTNDRGQPLRFTSDVSLWRDGTLLKRSLVEPNQPLYLAGFQFSQADFRREDPSYSGFGVVRDPSVSIVYFGMGILTIGVILLFYVYPLVARRRASSPR